MLRRVLPTLCRARAMNPAPRRLASAAASSAALKPEHLIKSPYSDIIIPDATISEYLWQGTEAHHDRVFVECGVSGRRVTYGQARDACVRLAVSLTAKLRLQRGDVVAVVLPNAPEFPVALLGALEAGLVVTTINPVYTAGEISKQLVNSAAKVIITDAPHYATVSAAAAEASKAAGAAPARVVCIRASAEGTAPLPAGAIDFAELTGPSVDVGTFKRPTDVDPEGLALLPYSSGTTGLPKGVMLSHRNIVSNLQMLHYKRVEIAQHSTGDYQEIYPAVLPFFHIYGLVVLLFNKMTYGAKVVSLPRFDPATFIKTLAQNQCTGLYVAPPLLLFLAAQEAVKASMLAPLKFIMCGAAPLGAPDVERLMLKAPPQMHVIQGYGMTETSPVVNQARREARKYASVGPPLSNTEMYIKDVSTGESLGPNAKGELCVRGPQVMLGYLNNPQATAETVDDQGFIHMGDIAYYDDEGDFYVVDRVKELIKVKGFQVPPAELEEVLRSHPAVLDAAVVGVEDGRAGEVPRAYIVPRPGAAAATPDDIAAFVAAKVAPYKQLKGGVRFIDTIPKNPSGKILRRQLKELS